MRISLFMRRPREGRAAGKDQAPGPCCPTVEPEFDPEALAKLREQMGEEFGSLLALFQAESGKHLEDVRAGIETGAWERARRAAHSLKSTAALFGLARLSATMRALEHLPPDAPVDAWREGLDEARKLRESGLALLHPK